MDLDRIVPSLGVIVDTAAAGGFAHLATAWCVGPGEWISALSDPISLGDSCRLLVAGSGAVVPLQVQDVEDGVVGFRAETDAATLQVSAQPLRKRMPLTVIGYPEVIDHPLLRLSRQSITAEDYLPFLCPWRVQGHLCLYGKDDGYLAGAYYPGLIGAPLLDDGGRVQGIALDGNLDSIHPPLIRFRRLEGGDI
jgi:hypothetical protein